MSKQALRLICLISMCLWSIPSQAQQAVWVNVAHGSYLGGNVAMTFPFQVPVETSQIAVTVAAYCAPRALASRAVTLDHHSGRTRTTDLRFMRQERFNGVIHAFYVIESWQRDVPLVTGASFSFAQVQNPQSQRACPMQIFALHGQ